MTAEPARIPLAVVAVVCLSISAAIVPTLSPPIILADDFRADRLTAVAEGELTAAVGEAGVFAAHASASAPLLDPSTTLVPGDPFVVGMRMQAAAALLRRFPIVHQTAGAEVAIHLPTRELPELARAVRIDPVDDGEAFRLAVDGLQQRLQIDGRTQRQTRAHHTTVDLPVFAMHRTAARLQQRLVAPMEAPGTTRTVTAAMSALATARGVGRYRGAPITNVVRNDQLALVVNAAALADQQAVLGEVAPAAHRGLRREALRVGITELGTVTGTTPVTDRLIARLPAPTDPGGIRVRTGVSADRALVALTDTASLSRRLVEAHRIHLDTAVTLTPLSRPPLPPHPPPSGAHAVAGETTRRTVTLTHTTIERTGRQTETGYELARARGTVQITTTAVRRWAAGTERTTTTVQTTETHQLAATLSMRPAPIAGADRPVPLAPIADRIADRALADWERGLASITETAVLQDRARHRRTVVAPVGPRVQRRLTAALAADRARYAAHARRIDPVHAITHGPPPATQLARSLPALEVPPRYHSIDERALISIRMAYRQAVLDDLARRAAQTDEVSSTLASVGLEPPPTLPEQQAGPGRFDLRVTPGYLSIRPVDGSGLSAVPNTTSVVPLVVRNQNLVSLPYEGAIDAIVDRVAPERTVDARQAASVLDALPAGHPASGPLRRGLAEAMAHPAEVSVRLLRPSLGAGADRRVDTALAQLPLTTQPAAFADGRLATAMTDDPVLRARLRVAHREAMRDVDGRIPAALLDPVARGITASVSDAAADRLDAAVRSRLPTGIPISPTLSPWVATVNLWQLQAEGQYLRMTLTDPESGLRYVRAGQPVRVHTADAVHTIGVARRLQIDVDTIIVAAVPPGPPGIGDIEGGRDERSPGFDRGPHCLPEHPRCPYAVRNGFAAG